MVPASSAFHTPSSKQTPPAPISAAFTATPFTRADRKVSTTMVFFDRHRHHYQQHHHHHTTSTKSNSTSYSTTTTTTTTELSSSTATRDDFATAFSPRRNGNFKIYCDMDGVLVDFEKGVQQLLHKGTSTIDKGFMWKNIAQTPHWFDRLEWKHDGKKLWNAISHLKPDILTGVPNIETSCVDKYNWCKRELQLDEAHHVDMAFADGPTVAHVSTNGNLPRDDTTNVITCWSNNKYRECKEGS
jgi:hypothetical protein